MASRAEKRIRLILECLGSVLADGVMNVDSDTELTEAALPAAAYTTPGASTPAAVVQAHRHHAHTVSVTAAMVNAGVGADIRGVSSNSSDGTVYPLNDSPPYHTQPSNSHLSSGKVEDVDKTYRCNCKNNADGTITYHSQDSAPPIDNTSILWDMPFKEVKVPPA